MTSLQVAVRVRPFNSREIKFESKQIIAMDDHGAMEMKIVRQGKLTNDPPRKFNFDFCFWTFDQGGSQVEPEVAAGAPPGATPNLQGTATYASQTTVFEKLGSTILNNSMQGYNSCLFAYGQTGSGKTYSMMGIPSDAGVIPRLCRDLFQQITNLKGTHTFTVECEYLEIYNENVRDLLNPSNHEPLKVRQHPKLGVFVEGLTKIMVASEAEVMKLLDEGGQVRTVAATLMNATSSRSHAILTLKILQRSKEGEKLSSLNLVDLAGSERAASTGATGSTLAEGANINKSLTTLGMCLSRLADLADGKSKAHVPYRDSQLTWLLNDSLGGNSKTAMLANISPADINFDETLSTLRFAATAKKIKNTAIVNEDPMQKIIRELRMEIETLRAQLKAFEEGEIADPTSEITSAADIVQQIQENQTLLVDILQSPEDKSKKNAELQRARQKGMKILTAVMVNKNLPHVVSLNPDLHKFKGVGILYYIREGDNLVGSGTGTELLITLPATMKVQAMHCNFRYNALEATVTLLPIEGTICINGNPTFSPFRLHHLDRVMIGKFVFRFAHPAAATDADAVVINRVAVSVDHSIALEEYSRMEIQVEYQTGMTELTDAYEAEMQEYASSATLDHTISSVVHQDARDYGMHLRARLSMLQEDLIQDFPLAAPERALPTQSPPHSPRVLNVGTSQDAEFEYAVWERQQVVAMEAERVAKIRQKEEEEATIATLRSQIKEKERQRDEKRMRGAETDDAGRQAEKQELVQRHALEDKWEAEKLTCQVWKADGPADPEEKKVWLSVFNATSVPTFGQIISADVDFQGAIEKLGPRKAFFFSGWKRRWAVLRKHFLFYFENNQSKDQKCIGVLYVYGSSSARLVGKYHDKDHCLKVHPCVPRRAQMSQAREEDHNFVFSAESSEAADIWLAHLEENALPEPPEHKKKSRRNLAGTFR